MTGMNNALLQLALMLQGNPTLRNGLGNSWGGPSNSDPWGSSTPPTHPVMNSWAAMPNPRYGMPRSHLPITPAQELFLYDPAYEVPFELAPKPWMQPPESTPLPPDMVPPPDAFPSPFPPEFPPIVTPHEPTFTPPKNWVPHHDQDEEDEENWPIPRKGDPCREEVLDAIAFCRKEIRRVKGLKSSGNFGVTFEQCMRGQLSGACGGNIVAQAGSSTPLS